MSHETARSLENDGHHTEQARTASLPAAEFAEFFGGRGVSLT
ncbi:hypothetical protein [Streptomyces yanii]|uniref:Uncharacterized protein n=1 Tax=Streptomyces yanii TaxID=78510 RepID=A0ABV5R230_9ACTN